jgi:F0F1-type ATP synthase assembly protein I
MNKVDPDLEALEAKISALKEATAPAEVSQDTKAKGEAMRFATDFIAATAVGAGLGIAVDYGLNSAPFGVVIGLMLGCATGVKMIWQYESNAAKKRDNA